MGSAGTLYGKNEEANLTRAERKSRATVKKGPTLGERISEGLEEAIAWSKGEDIPVRVTHMRVPYVDVS